jgi:predicted membrane channel-forming protein YqfA (hemolysin III family)
MVPCTYSVPFYTRYVFHCLSAAALLTTGQIRWPERSFPGAFDIWGSSHQIFHVFVLLAAMTHLYGMAKAFDYHHTVMGSQCLVRGV